MAFDRKIEMSVGPLGTGLLISDLHVSFNITRSVTLEENFGEFQIYNAEESTRKEILTKGNNLIFKAGYADQGIGSIFIGNIESSVSGRVGSDMITEIKAVAVQDINTPIDNTYVSLSYTENTSLTIPLRVIASALGLSIVGLNLADINQLKGFTFTGSARGALRKCKDILEADNLSLYVDNEELVIYNVLNREARFSAVNLNYDSGLLSIKDITETDNQNNTNQKRIEFETIMIWQIRPDALLAIQTPGLVGVYTVDKVEYSGDNFGGEFNCNGEAVG